MKPFDIEEYKKEFLSDERLEVLYSKRWFKMFVPKEYGGLQLNLVDGAKILTKSAAYQGGFGWTLNLGAGANWFCGFFEPSVAKALFSPRNAVIAGSGLTTGKFKQINNSVTIQGEWTKCTGAAHATLFSLNAKNDEGFVKSFVVPREKVTLSENKWPIFGLKNTSSFKIHLNKVSIPSSYGFVMNEVKNHHGYTLYHIPFESFARVCLTSSFIGIIKCLISEIEKELLAYKPDMINDFEKTLKLLIKAEDQRNNYAEELEFLSFSRELSEGFKNKLKVDLGEMNLLLFEYVEKLFLHGGLSFVEEDNLIHWCYRDVLTGVQHYMMKP
ncbi:MAG: hypothetical protein WED10_09780 [Brumimicrobium sp.]